MEKILMFNFAPARADKIISLASSYNVIVQEVPGSCQMLNIDELLFFNDVIGRNTPVFFEEMLLFSDFNDDRLSGFLRLMRENGVGSIPLKATVTKYNQKWTAFELYKELKREYEEFLKNQSNKGM